MKRTFIFGAVFILSASAHAQGPYLHGGLGLAKYDISQAEVDNLGQELVNVGFSSADVALDESSVMFKLGIGYELNQYLSVEGGYTSLGSLDLDVITTGPSATFSGELDTGGLEVSFIGKHQLNEESAIFGRLGLYSWDTDFDFSGTSGTTTVSDSSSVDGSDITFGGGFQLKQWRFEYQRYSLDDQNVDTFQVSYMFKLGS